MDKEQIEKLKQQFFTECTDAWHCGIDGLPDVTHSGHDMWQWILSNCLNVQEEKERSVLSGEDAELFIKAMAECKPVTAEDLARMEANYEFMKSLESKPI